MEEETPSNGQVLSLMNFSLFTLRGGEKVQMLVLSEEYTSRIPALLVGQGFLRSC